MRRGFGHVQQAVEKITKALLLAPGIEAGIEHRFEKLFKRFPTENEWPTRLLQFASYSAYATAFLYPTPGGRIPADPPADALRRDLYRFAISSWWLANNCSVRLLIAE